MTVQDLVIVGCGGHGREIFDTVAALNRIGPRWNVLGFVDDDPAHLDRVERLGQRVLGPVSWLEERPITYVLGIGSSQVRARLAAQLDCRGLSAATLVHPDATIGPDVELGPGSVVFARTVLTTNVRIGRHTHVNVGCAVQHDTVVGDFVQLSPAVFINGDCSIGDHTFVGTGAIVTRGCSIGQDATVGAGAVVLADVPSGSRVVGVPARPGTVRTDPTDRHEE